jgi:hypothetical protein
MMRVKYILKHMGIVLAGVLLLLGVPFFSTDYFKALRQGTTDTVSSASVVIDQPSGEYIVFINRDMHTDEDYLNTWIQFFSGEEISYLFEDISCSVIAADSGALDLARSFQSRLPEKQMRIQTEEASLLLSRADHGKYDIMILSKEFAETYNAATLDEKSTVQIEVRGGAA